MIQSDGGQLPHCADVQRQNLLDVWGISWAEQFTARWSWQIVWQFYGQYQIEYIRSWKHIFIWVPAKAKDIEWFWWRTKGPLYQDLICLMYCLFSLFMFALETNMSRWELPIFIFLSVQLQSARSLAKDSIMNNVWETTWVWGCYPLKQL